VALHRKTFAITGVAGFVASRHLEAIARLGGRVVAAHDPRDAVGFLDAFDLAVPFFSSQAEFERFLSGLGGGFDYLTVCAPNDVHSEHCRMGLTLGADVICEKPVVIDPRHLDQLERVEESTGRRIWTILQLRVNPRVEELRSQVVGGSLRERADVVMTYVSARGPWYDASWKGDEERSGGITMNIGVHMFDLLLWIFGPPRRAALHLLERRRAAGTLELDAADVRWFLSVEPADLERAGGPASRRTVRELVVDGRRIDLSTPGPLHDRVYERTTYGRGFGLCDARPSIELAYRLRRSPVDDARHGRHPFLPR
jgi:UDP-N-acetyl-2-amino-2-deoxyglucuronate dehydrogenase